MSVTSDDDHDPTPRKPIVVVGAGPLLSHVWRVGRQETGGEYEFDVLWMQSESGQVLQRYRAAHVRELVKLCCVLTSVLLDDGWLSPELRAELRELEDELSRLTCCRSEQE